MENKYKIQYTATFISQLNNILYYFTYYLNNKIIATNFYNEVITNIEKRSYYPESFQIFKNLIIKNLIGIKFK